MKDFNIDFYELKIETKIVDDEIRKKLYRKYNLRELPEKVKVATARSDGEWGRYCTLKFKKYCDFQVDLGKKLMMKIFKKGLQCEDISVIIKLKELRVVPKSMSILYNRILISNYCVYYLLDTSNSSDFNSIVDFQMHINRIAYKRILYNILRSLLLYKIDYSLSKIEATLGT